MNFKEYQEQATKFAEYESEYYPWLGLMEEAGELIQIMAKKSRGDDLVKRYGSAFKIREEIISEAGDVLWFLSEILSQCDLSLQDAAEINLAKLQGRKNNGTIKGSDKHDR